MKNQTHILKWAADCLVSKGYVLENPPETVLSTAWSTVFRFLTSTGDVYLKQTPPAIAIESKLIQFLSAQCDASVPALIAINDELHCFLMKDAGKSLRGVLKAEFKSDLLCQAINQYAAIQRSAEDYCETLIELGVPDWRLDKLPILYDQMIDRSDFLKADGMTDKELQILHDLSPEFSAQCALLSSYGIPETIGIPDFQDNNVLLDPNTKTLTFIDWGETVIIHPFLSLNTCLRQSIIHHGVKEGDQTYRELQDACFENWSELATKNKLEEVLILAKQLWPIYNILGTDRLMISVDLQAFNLYYANKPKSNRISGLFREYISKTSNNFAS